MKNCFYILCFVCFVFITGCSDNKVNKSDNTNDIVPKDIPISEGETNTTINEDNPPEPVMEKQE